MNELETIVIENNNPNQIFTLVLILVVIFIVVSLIEIKLLSDRKKRLEGVRKKIVKRHESMVFEFNRKEQLKKETNPDNPVYSFNYALRRRKCRNLCAAGTGSCSGNIGLPDEDRNILCKKWYQICKSISTEGKCERGSKKCKAEQSVVFYR